MAIQPQVTAGGSRQRLFVLALAGVLVVGLALLVARPLLLGASQVEAPAAPPVTTATAATATTTLIAPSTTPPSSQPPGSTKDPFRPLVVAGAAGASPTTAGATATTVQSSQTTVPGGGATAERKVTLLDVFSRSGTRYAKVSCDGSSYTVKEGQSFADDYRVLDIGGACATFESGVTRFTLCEDEAILK
jgi:hypothetical protein